MNWNLFYNKNDISNQRRKCELSKSSVGTIWKNKYRYLLHATITPNEVKTQLEKTKLQPDQKKRWKIFHWDMIFLSKT